MNANKLHKILFWIILVSLCLIPKVFAAENISTLLKGNIILRFLNTPPNGNLKGAEGKILIRTSPEEVWKMLDDQERMGKIIPGVKGIKVLEKRQNYQKSQVSLSTVAVLPVFKYTLLLDESNKYKEIKFKRIDGSFKQLYGSWQIEPYRQYTILTYTMYIDFGFYMPSFLRIYGLNNTLPQTLKAIKNELE